MNNNNIFSNSLYKYIIIYLSPLLMMGQIEFQSQLNPNSVGKHGSDTIQCEENLTIYNEFYLLKQSYFMYPLNIPYKKHNIPRT